MAHPISFLRKIGEDSAAISQAQGRRLGASRLATPKVAGFFMPLFISQTNHFVTLNFSRVLSKFIIVGLNNNVPVAGLFSSIGALLGSLPFTVG